MQADPAKLMRLTITAPREAAARLLALSLPPVVVWTGFGIVVTLSAVMGWLTMAAAPPEAAALALSLSPLGFAVVQAFSIVFLALGAAFGGRLFGGQGTFSQALLLSVWLQVLLLAMQFLQLVLMLAAPILSALLGYAGVALFLWVLTNFIAALHGFSSLAKVFGGIILGFLIAGVLLLIFLGTPAPGV